MGLYASLLAFFVTCSVSAAPVTSNEHMKWFRCPDIDLKTTVAYNCSTLTVPLDYASPSTSSIDLEIVKVYALQQPSRGSILFNFGGPGGEGRNAAVSSAAQLLASTGGVYDLVAFDPRGTANTIPFNCSHSAVETYFLYSGFRLGNSSDVAIGQDWARAQLASAQCFDIHRDIGEHIGTATTARDLMSVVDALKEDGLLRFWGLSYGTTLGATVAAMFPDRIDKMILDGVQNVHEYYNALGIIEQWTDSDKVFSGMWSTCIDAGPGLCPLAASYNDTHALEGAIWNLLWSVKQDPVAIGSNTSYVVDYDVLKGIFTTSMYSTALWPLTAVVVDKLLKKEYGDDLLALVSLIVPTTFESLVSEIKLLLANFGIQCSDRSPDARVNSLSALKSTFEQLGATSRIM